MQPKVGPALAALLAQRRRRGGGGGALAGVANQEDAPDHPSSWWSRIIA